MGDTLDRWGSLATFPISPPFSLHSLSLSSQVRWEIVARQPFANLHQPRLNGSVITSVVDASQFGTPKRRDHLIDFSPSLGLPLHEAMFGCGIDRPPAEQVRRLGEWHFATGAAIILDVKVARDVRGMWLMF